MSSYLSHMDDLGDSRSFARRVAYLEYNFSQEIAGVVASNGAVLEIGPGYGEFVQVLGRHGIADIDLVDQDMGVLDFCRTHYRVRRLIKSRGGFPARALGSRRYQLIVLIQVFEHLPRPLYREWITGLYRALAPGGKLIITVPNGANPLSGTERYGDLQHENAFTVYSLRQLVTESTLTGAGVDIRGFEIPPSSAVNILRRFAQKILHAFFLLLMLVNGAIYQRLLTPSLTLIVTKKAA